MTDHIIINKKKSVYVLIYLYLLKSLLCHLVQMPEGFIILYLFAPGTLLLSVCVLLRSRLVDSRLRFHF